MVGPAQAVASMSNQYDNQIVGGLVLPSPPALVGKPNNGTLGWLRFNASSDAANVMFCTTYSVLCANLLSVPGITTANCPSTATLTWMGAIPTGSPICAASLTMMQNSYPNFQLCNTTGCNAPPSVSGVSSINGGVTNALAMLVVVLAALMLV
jgi:hypothetical protein